MWKPDAVYEITLLNDSHLLVETDNQLDSTDSGTGSDIADGDQLQITGSQTATFEFDAGYVLQLGQPLALDIKNGVNATGLRFGDTIVFEYDVDKDRLTLNSRFVTLQFVAVGDSVSTPGFIPVPVSNGASALEVRDAILLALKTLNQAGRARRSRIPQDECICDGIRSSIQRI